MPNDFKSKMPGTSLPRVFLAKPKFYRGVPHPGNLPGNRPWTMGAQMPDDAIRFTITPKGKGAIIEVKEETSWTPWIIGGLLGIGALALLANKTKARKKLRALL